MIKSVTVINPQGERLTLELRNPIKSGIAVRDISGLGPPHAQVTMSKVSNLDGVRKSSATVGGRNIVLKLGLLNLPTVEEVRLKTYQFFPIKQLVQLIIESDTRTVWVEGTVETNTPTIFDPETTSQVSIVTEEAYLLDASAKRVAGEKFFSTQPLFEFPFVNALGTKSLEFGRVVTQLEKDVLYPGDAEVGVRVTIDFLGNVENPVVFKPLETQALRLDSAVVRALTGAGFVSGDRVIINTRVGQKSAQLYRNGVYTNIMNALGRRVDWLTFRRGINRLKYSATSGVENLQIQIESDILYEGI